MLVNSAAPPVSVKIENCSESPPYPRSSDDSNRLTSCHGNDPSLSYSKSLPSTQSHKPLSSKSSSCRLDDSCCPHAGAIKPVKSRCTSPRQAGVRICHSRSGSRSPSASNPARSRSHHSRQSVDIKTECSTPTFHKKSARYFVMLVL